MICVVGSVHCFWNDTGLEPIIRSEVIRDSECACWDGSDTEWEPECRCVGEKLMDVPKNLSRNVMRLAVDGAGIAVLRASSLQPYRNTLQDFALMNVKNLRVLEGGVFQNLTHLRTIYIYHAPALSTFPSDVFNVELPRLKILRIVHTGLVSPPDLRRLTIPSALMMLLSLIKENFFSNVSNLRYLFLGAQYSELDLENNQIQKLCTGQIQVRTEHLVLNYNVIEEVESRAFENSQVGKLSLRGNRALTTLHPDSFLGLRSLRYLDLSDTSITYLPTTGLHELDVLWIQDTKSLKVFPSVFHFEYIREVYLTYPYHCCAFHFPARHDPEEYDRHLEFMKAVQRACDSQANERTNGDRRRRSSRRAAWGVLLSPASPVTLSSTEANGIFHTNVTVGPGIRIHALCGNVSKKYSDVKCIPSPDAFNPCEDLMGNWALRSAAWVVAVAALIGNFSVLFVLLSSRFRMTVPKFLMCNLAMADLCMGIYLLMIAVMDARSIGDYFNHAIDWQSGAGCRVAGFLTVLGCELSIFTLTVITIERWYTITYAIHLNKRLKLSTTAKIMSLGWVYSLCMASLPLFGISSYSKTSICLPLEKIKAEDMSYLVTLLIFNGLAFWVICTSYARMYCSIKGGQDAVAALTRSDMTVAKRMALLVFTDFACWAPIAFFGVTALAGYPLIDLSKTKILLVFFYPLNSCANPYLYALLTQQYRRDLFVLLSRYGICSLRAARYKGTGVIHRCNTGQSVRNNNEPRRDNSVPNHRGSVLTTVTSLDCPASNTRPGSLTAVPEFSVQQLPLHTLPSEEQRVRHHSNGTNKTASSFL